MEIEVRHAEPDDYRGVHRVHTQPRVIWGTLQLPFASVELWKKRLADKPDDLYALVACVEGDIVGSLALQMHTRSPRTRHAGDIGMAVHDEWQGLGVGSALLSGAIELADGWLNLTRLELQVFTDNEPAIKLYRKFGFEIEGTMRKYAYREGVYIDAVFMARLR